MKYGYRVMIFALLLVLFVLAMCSRRESYANPTPTPPCYVNNPNQFTCDYQAKCQYPIDNINVYDVSNLQKCKDYVAANKQKYLCYRWFNNECQSVSCPDPQYIDNNYVFHTEADCKAKHPTSN